MLVVEVLRRAWQQHGDPARQIEPGEVVVADVGCMDGMADEDRRRLDPVRAGTEVRPRQELVAQLQFDGAAATHHCQPRAFGLRYRTQQRHRLEEAAVVAGRLQARIGELRSHIGRGKVVAAAAGFAPFHAVVGEPPQVDRDALGGGVVGQRRGVVEVRRGRHRPFDLRIGAGPQPQQAQQQQCGDREGGEEQAQGASWSGHGAVVSESCHSAAIARASG